MCYLLFFDIIKPPSVSFFEGCIPGVASSTSILLHLFLIFSSFHFFTSFFCGSFSELTGPPSLWDPRIRLRSQKKPPSTSSFSISPSRSALHQSLSFHLAEDVQEIADIASSASCAKEGEQEPKEELSRKNHLRLLTAPSLVTSLPDSFHFPIFPTCAYVPIAPMLLLSSLF